MYKGNSIFNGELIEIKGYFIKGVIPWTIEILK